jgi:DNA polymerase V
LSRKFFTKVNKESGIGGRLKLLREGGGHRIAEFAKILGVSGGFISEVENNNKKLGLDLLLSLKKTHKNLDIDWLLSGEGKMYRDTGKVTSEPAEPPIDPSLSDRFVDLERKVNYLLNRVGPKQSIAITRELPDDFLYIPLYLHAVAAGSPTPADNDIAEYLPFPRQYLRHPKKTYALRAEGNSMTRANINHGDIIVADAEMTPQNDSVVIALVRNEVTVKRLSIHGGRIYLKPESDSAGYKEILVDNDVVIQGVVLFIIHFTEPLKRN